MAEGLRMDRRKFLQVGCAGLCGTGSLGLFPELSLAAEIGDGHPLAPRPGHFPAKAKRLVFVFLTGGFSHIDTFDPKPALRERHGQEYEGGYIMGSQYKFEKCGKSGIDISDLFPQMRTVADELCVIRSMFTDNGDHFQGTLAMHTGSGTIPMPSIGSWVSYGLGTENPNLPSYMILAEHLPYAGGQVWDCSFLPPYHTGVRIEPGDNPIRDLNPAVDSVSIRELESRMLEDLNLRHANLRPEDLDLRGRMNSFNTALGMMREAPEVFDLSAESDKSLESYGIERGENKSFAWQCMIARRLLEKGVRVVELIDTGASNNWDAHGDMEHHRDKARRIDLPLTAFIKDLKERGLLDETLIAVCTEFGRTPGNPTPTEKGRSHHRLAFTCLLVGGGTKGGYIYGESDELGHHVAKDKVHVHDYHATILHLLGMDHKRLTYRYGGRDFRLTDVHGNVVDALIA